MYFLLNDGRITAYKTLGDACRMYCIQHGLRVLGSTDPVSSAMDLNAGNVPALNISALLAAIATADHPPSLALEARRAVEDYYGR